MVAVIKYNAGNSKSVINCLERLKYEYILTDDPDEIRKADRVIFPGVGEASSAMTYLKEKGLDKVIINLKQPFLGICLGLQLMCKHSEEGNADCLGIFDTLVKKFPTKDKVPHMGWVDFVQHRIIPGNGLFFYEITVHTDFYYVHSYYAELCEHTIGTTRYQLDFSSMIRKDNFMGVQFHPEKSGEAGDQIMLNFLKQG